MSATAQPIHRPESATDASTQDRAFAGLIGLHGLALMVIFPLGPQVARLWHPGINGFAVLTAAFPFAVVIGGLLARRVSRLPTTSRTLALIGFAATLPCALVVNYPSLVTARLIAGAATGATYVALHRRLSPAASPLVTHFAPRIIAFGMPVCLLVGTAADLRAAFIPILVGFLLITALSSSRAKSPAPDAVLLTEAAPSALIATGALAFVSAAYLTVLSGFLVFNAGHTEFHIPVVLALAALFGLAVPPVLSRLGRSLSPAAVFVSALGFSAASLLALLILRESQPAALAVSVIALFLVANSTRHIALARLVLPHLEPGQLAPHQTHTHLAHHLGSGAGALTAGVLISFTPARTLTGMPALLAASLIATTLALASGLLSARSPTARIRRAGNPCHPVQN